MERALKRDHFYNVDKSFVLQNQPKKSKIVISSEIGITCDN
jgi:hypothetical protein